MKSKYAEKYPYLLLFRKFFNYVNAVILRFCGIRYNLSADYLHYYITLNTICKAQICKNLIYFAAELIFQPSDQASERKQK